MGVFLRFGEEGRLQEVVEISAGNYGSHDPQGAFPRREPGDECLEVHPAVLEKMRPSALHELRGHCVLTREGVKVDSLGTIRARLTLQAKASLEKELIRSAEMLGSLQVARGLLGESFPKLGDHEITHRESDIEKLKGRIVLLQDQLVTVQGALADLAGKVVPI